MSESTDAREWHRIIRASVRECLETWVLQPEAGQVTVEALEAILAPRHHPDPAPGRGASARVGGRAAPEPDPHHARGLRGGDGRATGVEGIGPWGHGSSRRRSQLAS